MLVSFVLSFFPRDGLDEILNLIGSVSEGFPSYSLISRNVEKDVMIKLGKIYIDTILKQSCICDDCILHAYNCVDFKVYSHNIQY